MNTFNVAVLFVVVGLFVARQFHYRKIRKDLIGTIDRFSVALSDKFTTKCKINVESTSNINAIVELLTDDQFMGKVYIHKDSSSFSYVVSRKDYHKHHYRNLSKKVA